MKIVQSFFPKEYLDSSLYKEEWLSNKYLYYSYALSSLMLREFYDEIELVTNEDGKKIMIDLLQLPYTKVDMLSGEEMKGSQLICNGLAKAYSCARQTTPFVYVDHDVFVSNSFDLLTINQKVFSFRLKKNDHHDYKALNILKGNSPHIFKTSSRRVENTFIELYQCKVFGGKDNAFFIRYFNELRDYFRKNTDFIKGLSPETVNNFIPDYFFYHRSIQEGKKITVLSEIEYDENQLKGFDIFYASPKESPICYIPSILKSEINTLISLAFRLKQKYRYHYNLVEEHFKNPAVKFNRAENRNTDDLNNKKYSTSGFKPEPEKQIIPGERNSFAEKTDSASFKRNFTRTLKALELIYPGLFLQLNTQEFNNTQFIRQLEESTQIKEGEFLNDIFSFEKAKYNYAISSISDEELIGNESKRLAELNDIFDQEKSLLLNQKFTLSNSVRIHESMWKWGIYLDIKELIPLRVIYNLPLPSKFYQTLFWKESITFSVREYDMEEIDIILLDSFRESFTINQAIDNLVNYFEDINERNRDLLVSLALKRLKEYYYMGALKIVASKSIS